ncbi:hypothetical protein [Ferrimonas sp. SCSIO 43195]|uniref:helix-turn-helix transcriptional regulator n=1 Tax=Ferrimonas sp. SCSIO 43195 TaxID=2822844 RepID=UPI002076215E|nr:hypothetical protein [Ferrimonas sp. SCSIO 43195]USD38717.1 hypothetical protein J8Z22_06330 [Ferrimonas sp. SCSIO 43195]
MSQALRPYSPQSPEPTAELSSVPAAAGIGPRLARLRDQFGFADLCYYYDLTTLDQWSVGGLEKAKLIKKMTKRRNLFTSSVAARKLWQDQSRCYHSAEEDLQAMFDRPCHHWNLGPSQGPLRKSLYRHGYQHKLTLSIPCPLATAMTGRFTLLFANGDEHQQTLDSLEALTAELRLTNLQLSLDYSRDINPLVDYNIISPVSAYVLKLLAQGHSRDSMAQTMNLTLRGIDYHIGVLKQSLQASNIANLIDKGNKVRLL